ncbi:hypothetical protein [Bradyrhizobium oligotrophicum]|uniref:hypothetical protein n=1 Tax=Bradyrhizobium oligotrophicum TaxID=44255 RepID=UPI003EBF4A90
MYKVVFHRLIWFPYRPEHALVGPLLMALLFLVAATGAIKAIDIFTSLGTQAVGHEARITVVVLLLCLVVCINAARADYISVVAAILPCLVTVLVVTVLSLLGTWPRSDMNAALMQASVSAFAALSLIGRLVQSGGPDLGKIGVLWRRAKAHVRRLKDTDVQKTDFKVKRAELVEDVESLAKELKEAASQLVEPGLPRGVEKKLRSFIAYSKMASHADFMAAATQGQESLVETLTVLNQGLR